MENSNENLKVNNKVNSMIIVALILLVVAFGGYFIYNEIIKDEDTSKSNENNTLEPTPVPTANEEKEPTVENKITNNSIEVGVNYSYKIKHDGVYKVENTMLFNGENKTFTMEYTSKDEDNWDATYKVDGAVFEKVEDCMIPSGTFLDYTKLYLINNEVIVLTGGKGLALYDKNLNKINYDIDGQLNTLDSGMRIVSFFEGLEDRSIVVENNKISFFANRNVDLLGSSKIYYNGEEIDPRTTSGYEELDCEARYEFEYLGNGEFSNLRKIKTITKVKDIYKQ